MAAVITNEYWLIPGRIRIAVQGLHRNPGYGQYLAKKLPTEKGIQAVTANPLTGRALILFDNNLVGLAEIQDLLRASHQAFFSQMPKLPVISLASGNSAALLSKSHSKFTLTTGGIIAGLILKRLLVGRSQVSSSPYIFNLAALTTILAGYPMLYDSLGALTRKQRLSHDLILYITSLLLLTMRESLTGLSVLWLVNLSNLFRYRTQANAEAQVNSLLAGKQQTIRRLANLKREYVTGNELNDGDVVAVRAGEVIPVDGQVIAGKAVVSQAALTGHCQLQLKAVGDNVFAGTQLRAGALKVRADKVGNNVGAAQFEKLSDRSLAGKMLRSPPGSYAGRVMWLTIAAAAAAFILTRDYKRSLAILLAGCPASITLARNTALSNGVSTAAEQGILVKDLEALERMGQVDTVLFDKTGTLTLAHPIITDIIPLRSVTAADLLTLAASVERSTSHPLARMLTKTAAERKLALLPVKNRTYLDAGISAEVADQKVIVGSKLCMEQQKIPLTRHSIVPNLKDPGNSVLYVAADNKLVGLILVRDVVRPESARAIDELRSVGVKDIGIITGDCASAVQDIAAKTKIHSYWHSLQPHDKVDVVTRLQKAGRQVAVVGDGINDSPALSASQVGVAMGTIGAWQAIAAADIVIADDNPNKVARTISISRKTSKLVKQNLGLAIGMSAGGIALAAAGLMGPVTAGLLLNISTLAVIFNSGRLLTHRKKMQQMDLQHFARNTSSENYSNTKSNLIPFPLKRQNSSEAILPSWHNTPAVLVSDRLKTSRQLGLSPREAKLRLSQYGKNALQEPQKPSFWKLLGAQFKDFMVQVLLGAAGLAFAIGKTKDALLTVGIVAANAILGVVQERKASSSLDALKKLSVPQAHVIRDGRTAKVSAKTLVPGDLVVLEAGDCIPADVRLLTTKQFEVEEAALTGETVPVKKDADTTCLDACPLAERRNMAFMGTNVTRGRATAIVIATGMETEMGKIAALIQGHEDEQTPLQRRLEELGKYLVYGCLTVSGIIFLAGLMRGQAALTMLQTAASLTVAAIPEGLTAIVIIALAMGVERMSKRNIIIRKLSSIETLGCATAICSDKTGTLTQNKMTVREIYTADRIWKLSGEGYSLYGEFFHQEKAISPLSNNELMATLKAGTLCNNARLIRGNSQQDNGVDGDPTEGSLLVAGAKAGLEPGELAARNERLAEYPFEAERRLMSVVCQERGTPTVYTKGSPDKVLSLCTHYVKDGQVLPLDDSMRKKVNKAHTQMAEKAMRILACAYRRLEHFDGQEQACQLEAELILTGLVGMIDPPRPEVPEAITKCHAAGAKVIMITGDHPITAKAIACEIGLMAKGGAVTVGSELDCMSDAELENVVAKTNVYARTSPQQKLRIVKALKSQGFIVVMTGDGVNDAPAVKYADIGIAMGRTGTDVTKQAASMTLSDDNFATIVKAMEEGRSIYANIRKAIRYLVATNIGEVILMLIAAIIGLPLPLLPIQLLWINLIGDGLPAIALVNDPPAKDIMSKPPKAADQSVLAGGLGRKVITRGLIIGFASLALFAWKLKNTGSLLLARSLIIAQLAISQFIHLFDCRIEKENGIAGLLSNSWLIGAFSLSMAMIVGIIHAPRLQPVFGTVALTASDWLLATLIAAITSAADFGIEAIIGKDSTKRLSKFNTPIVAE